MSNQTKKLVLAFRVLAFRVLALIVFISAVCATLSWFNWHLVVVILLFLWGNNIERRAEKIEKGGEA